MESEDMDADERADRVAEEHDDSLCCNERLPRGAVLTERDKFLVAYVAVARYLSTDQIRRLAFPGRELLTCRRRLLRLAGLWKASGVRTTKPGVHENFSTPFLRRREFQTFSGRIIEVWALTEAGYNLAEHVRGIPQRIPRGDVGAEFLEHSVALNDVLVGLVDPAIRSCRRCSGRAWQWQVRDGRHIALCTCGELLQASVVSPKELPFRWVTSECARLPWTEYNRKTGKAEERVISPDAILELGDRRFFIECEMGSHSIVGNESKTGSTIAKVERYEKLVSGIGDPRTGQTSYKRLFDDALEPELLFVVPSIVRRENVKRAISEWAKPGRRLKTRTLTFDEAPVELLGCAEIQPSRVTDKTWSVSSDEVRALLEFYNSVIAANKRARIEARAACSPLPDYPSGTQTVGGLLKRLLGDNRGGLQ